MHAYIQTYELEYDVTAEMDQNTHITLSNVSKFEGAKCSWFLIDWKFTFQYHLFNSYIQGTQTHTRTHTHTHTHTVSVEVSESCTFDPQ